MYSGVKLEKQEKTRQSLPIIRIEFLFQLRFHNLYPRKFLPRDPWCSQDTRCTKVALCISKKEREWEGELYFTSVGWWKQNNSSVNSVMIQIQPRDGCITVS